MKYQDKYPDIEDDIEVVDKLSTNEYANLIRRSKKELCSYCGDQTNFVNIDYDMFLCSSECCCSIMKDMFEGIDNLEIIEDYETDNDYFIEGDY